MSKARDLADFISTGSILSDGTIESTEISGVTADATEINKLDGLTADTAELNKLDGVTATTAELNKLAGTTATTSDFDKLSNVTASATELNYMTGATSSIQSQLDNISVTSGSLTKSFTSGESATITLAQSITPAPVVSVTKEVPQTGQSSKGAWDVNATASNYDLHNTAYATTLTPSSVANTNISDATYANKSFGSGANSLRDIKFNDDGTEMYALDYGSNFINKYTLTTAYDISTASYANVYYQFTVATGPVGMAFNSDGTRLFVISLVNDGLYEHSLSTAYDISTLSYITGSNFYLGNEETSPRGVFFKPDGTKFYTVGVDFDTVDEWHLSTAWDLSSGNQSNSQASFATGASSPRSVDFNSTGTKMYIGNGDDTIYQYTLSTAWDVSSASYDGASTDLDTRSQVGNGLQGVVFANDNIYVASDVGQNIYQYTNSSNALVLGTGSFASTDVGKRIQGNGGDVILTSTAGAYDTTGGSAFTDSSTIASGSWTMHGLKSAGASSGLTIGGLAQNYADVNLWSDDSVAFDMSAYIGLPMDIHWKPDGTKVFIASYHDDRIYDFSLTTAWDITTASYLRHLQINSASYGSSTSGVAFKPDGTKLYVTNMGFDYILQYNLSTAWDLSTASFYTAKDATTANYGSVNNPHGIVFKPDGTSFFMPSQTDNDVTQIGLTTAWDLSSSPTVIGSFSTSSQALYPQGLALNGDGTKMYVNLGEKIYQYSLSTPYNVTTALYDSLFTTVTNRDRGLAFKDDGSKVYILGNTLDSIHQYNSVTATIPTSSYHLAVTNSGGQIDAQYWTDINSMTADQSLGDGEAYYAVSTDDRTTWSVAKGSDGVRPIVRNNAGTWQYNTAASTTGYSLSNFTYANKSYDASATHPNNVFGLYFKPDGTSIYALDFTAGDVYQHNLSTAYDISTASYSGNSFNATQFTNGIGLAFSYDGTKVYIASGDGGNETVYQYNLTTAWDISTASYANKSFNPTSQVGNTFGLAINDDGSSFYIADNNTSTVYQYTLSTPYDISTASYANKSQAMSAGSLPYDIHFTSDGLLLFIADSGGEHLEKHTLTTAWDLSTASFTERVYTYNINQVVNISGVTFNSDGTKLYLSTGGSSATIYQYSTEEVAYTTSTTWTDATTNDEFYALQQALGATSVNRMDKTQLDAVADGSHFTLGNTLDLMIALKQDTASASLPTSDGVTINYDAEALNQGAVLGTDYDFDFPANNKVRITSNAAQNLKIRVV